jgi:hypothetical protein
VRGSLIKSAGMATMQQRTEKALLTG